MEDLINAAFEFAGGAVLLLNIQKILRDRLVRGFDWRVLAFFTSWGFWNLYYYPHLGQWLSFAAGVFLVVTNSAYLVLIMYYLRKEKVHDSAIHHHTGLGLPIWGTHRSKHWLG